MDTDRLWNHEEPVTELGIDVPAWIGQDIDGATVAAILQGGCASGAYMPAVTYHQALATMAEHGEALTAYLGDYAEPVTIDFANQSWAGFCSDLVAMAVELWAGSVADEIAEALEEIEEEEAATT